MTPARSSPDISLKGDTRENHVDLGVLRDLIGYHVRRAAGAFLNDFTSALSGTGMRQVLFGILAVIDRDPGVQQGEVGRRLGIKRANMVALINELVEAGWVERRPAAADRRALALSLSPAGRKAFEAALRKIRQHEAEMLSGLSAAERATLADLLGRISGRNSDQSGSPT